MFLTTKQKNYNNAPTLPHIQLHFIQKAAIAHLLPRYWTTYDCCCVPSSIAFYAAERTILMFVLIKYNECLFNDSCLFSRKFIQYQCMLKKTKIDKRNLKLNLWMKLWTQRGNIIMSSILNQYSREMSCVFPFD